MIPKFCFRCSWCGWELWDGGPLLGAPFQECPLCGWPFVFSWTDAVPLHKQEAVDFGNVWERTKYNRLVALTKIHAYDFLSFKRKRR